MGQQPRAFGAVVRRRVEKGTHDAADGIDGGDGD
jgi:hypothetical protein